MNIYTVGQINAYIKNMFSQDYLLHSVIVSGEVSNLKYHSSGHIYFTLKDETGILPAVMFRSNAQKLKMKLADGDKVEAAGSVGTYERSGNYQLYVTSVKKAGAGLQHEELERLKKKLLEMGVFDPVYKKPIPKYNFRIGVVTSPTGSVIHDIRQVCARRNPGVEIILRSAKVQGEGAASSIIAGIEALAGDGVDVIIIGRGGGSDEDLSAFNDEALAMAVFDCPVPVISAVGHGDDESITDMVADAHAPTPSAAAELAVFSYDDFVRDVNMRSMTMEQMIKKIIDTKAAALQHRALRMDALSPMSKIKLQKAGYAGRAQKLDLLMKKRLEASRTRLMVCIEKYRGLSPLEKIAHGYAAVTDAGGRRITGPDAVSEGDAIRLTMRTGLIDALVTGVVEREL